MSKDAAVNDEGVEITGPPDGAGIAETVKWACENEVSLSEPPWEDGFCGSNVSCVYAGMVEATGHCSHHTMLKHATWLINDVALVREKEGTKPAVTRYPAKSFFIAVMDVTDEEEPKTHIFLYDGRETVKQCSPQITPYSESDADRGGRKYSSPYRNIRPLAVEGFCNELEGVIGDYLRTEAELREEAVNDVKGEVEIHGCGCEGDDCDDHSHAEGCECSHSTA